MLQSELNNGDGDEEDEMRDVDAAEKARRRWRTENKMSSVNDRRNTKNRKAEAERSNTKRGKAWRREVE
jgi:hypothetical protein